MQVGRDGAWNEEIWLLGVPRLTDYVDFVKYRTLGGRDADEGELIEQWRVAARRYRQLETTEAGAADEPEVLELPPAMAPLLERVLADPVFRKAFSTSAVAFGMVELDRLVVYQRDVTLGLAESLAETFGPRPSDEDVFRICLPVDPPLPQVGMARVGPRRFEFHCAAHDLRFLGAELLDASQLVDVTADGPVAGVVALLVGFGSNTLNVVRRGRRMVLNNGYHRAYALRSLGITHAPCVIQVVEHAEEMPYAGASEIEEFADFYFESPRPPLLRDFFDPDLTRVFRTPRLRRRIQVSYETASHRVPW